MDCFFQLNLFRKSRITVIRETELLLAHFLSDFGKEG